MHIYTNTLMYTTHRKTKINLKEKKETKEVDIGEMFPLTTT